MQHCLSPEFTKTTFTTFTFLFQKYKLLFYWNSSPFTFAFTLSLALSYHISFAFPFGFIKSHDIPIIIQWPALSFIKDQFIYLSMRSFCLFLRLPQLACIFRQGFSSIESQKYCLTFAVCLKSTFLCVWLIF